MFLNNPVYQKRYDEIPQSKIEYDLQMYYPSVFLQLSYHKYFPICSPPAPLHITFRLYATFQPAHKANRRFAAGWNVGEGGVGRSVATDLADPNPGAALRRRSAYRPVMCRLFHRFRDGSP